MTLNMTVEEARVILHPETTKEALAGMEHDEAVRVVTIASLKACEALDKQIPMTPKKIIESINGLPTSGLCPVCGQWVSECHKHCDECGQRLGWERGDKG